MTLDQSSKEFIFCSFLRRRDRHALKEDPAGGLSVRMKRRWPLWDVKSGRAGKHFAPGSSGSITASGGGSALPCSSRAASCACRGGCWSVHASGMVQGQRCTQTPSALPGNLDGHPVAPTLCRQRQHTVRCAAATSRACASRVDAAPRWHAPACPAPRCCPRASSARRPA